MQINGNAPLNSLRNDAKIHTTEKETNSALKSRVTRADLLFSMHASMSLATFVYGAYLNSRLSDSLHIPRAPIAHGRFERNCNTLFIISNTFIHVGYAIKYYIERATALNQIR